MKVRRNVAIGLDQAIESGKELLLGFETLDNRFANPVGAHRPVEVLLHGSQPNGVGGLGHVKVGRSRSLGSVETAAHRLLRCVEQRDVESEVGQMGGDAAAHGSGSDDANVGTWSEHTSLGRLPLSFDTSVEPIVK
jgi:hypothetical protein